MGVAMALAPDCSNSNAKALEFLQSCTKPSICFTCKVSSFTPLVIFLGLLPPNHIQNMYQTYNGNSLVFEKKMVEIMHTGFGICTHVNFKQKTIWILSEGFTMKFTLVQTMTLNQQRNKPLTHWHLRDRDVIEKIPFSILFCWFGIFGFSYDNAIRCHGT